MKNKWFYKFDDTGNDPITGKTLDDRIEQFISYVAYDRDLGKNMHGTMDCYQVDFKRFVLDEIKIIERRLDD